MKLKRWDGDKLVDVTTQDLPDFAREGIYVENADGTRHLWIYGGADPVPTGPQIKQKIEKEVPH